MKVSRLDDYVGGWFIGSFDPTFLQTSSFEVCVKRYLAGEKEPTHHQLIATEYTVVISGQCRLGTQKLGPNDIVRIDPMESADFEALTDVVLVAVKVPSIPADKRVGEFTGD